MYHRYTITNNYIVIDDQACNPAHDPSVIDCKPKHFQLMNWKFIFSLSLFGLAMAIATVYFIPSNIEPFFWLLIFVICAWRIAKVCSAKYFLHGLFVCLLNCVWITAAHIILFNAYINNHPQEAAMLQRTPLPSYPRLMMTLMGPVVGIVSGIIMGLFALIASKMIRK